jgi:hypothetical protein
LRRVLIACEESQVVTKAMRQIGLDAFSCDIKACSGGKPEWHLQQDVTSILKDDWDLIIAFPPCTDLCSSGARWFEQKRHSGAQQRAVEFFTLFTNLNCPRVAIENPVGIMSTVWRKPDHIIQPWQFGHGETKATCLWLKGLPLLQPTNIVEGREQRVWKMGPNKNRAELRSKTYPGIAEAMANQWGKLLVCH